MTNSKIPDSFIAYAASILADTEMGLSGGQIVQYCNSYAVDYNVNIPITSADFKAYGNSVPNKRTALQKNLSVFNGKQQFHIIKELSELPDLKNNPDVEELRQRLFDRYSNYSDSPLLGQENGQTNPGQADSKELGDYSKIIGKVTSNQKMSIYDKLLELIKRGELLEKKRIKPRACQ